MSSFDFSIQRREYHAVCRFCGWERADTVYERFWEDVQGHRCPGADLPAVRVVNTARTPLEAP